MSFPVITDARATVTGNNVEFVVEVDITGATDPTTVYVEYGVSGSSSSYYASYSHYSNSGNFYSYYFYANNLDYGLSYTFEAYLEDTNGNKVDQYFGNFIIDPEATILNFTNSVTQNIVTFTLEIEYNVGVYPNNYNVKVFFDLIGAANYDYTATLQTVSGSGRIYTYTFTYSGLIYGESFKCLSQVLYGVRVIDSLIGNYFITNTDNSHIIDVVIKPKVNNAKCETETTLVYLTDTYKIKITYDKSQITPASKFKETTNHSTNLNNNEVFSITVTNLSDKTKYNCKIELYNMSVTMLADGQLLDSVTKQFKTLDGFKLWMYLWYRL